MGLYNSRTYYKLDPTSGAILAGPISAGTTTPYGAVVNSSGMLFSAGLTSAIAKLDTVTGTFISNHGVPGSYNYAITISGGKVYMGYGSPLKVFDPATNLFSAINLGFSTLGVSTASNGDLLVHGNNVSWFGYGSGASRIRTDGSIVWSKSNQAGANDGEGRGCVPDSNGDVWTINLGTNNVSKYKGSDGTPLGVFPVGLSPYTYSDATGSTFVQVTGLGRWTAVFDTQSIASDDAIISWNASIPAGASLVVGSAASNIKSAPTDYAPGDFTPVTNGGTASLQGRYQAVQVTFNAAPLTNVSSTLFDLTIQAPCAKVDINQDGCVDTTDMNLLLAAIRARSIDPKYDVNCDGIVHITDSRYLATKYTNPSGAPCP